MKKLLLMVAAMFVVATSFAQTTADSKVIKADIGFGLTGFPISASYEQGILEFKDGSFLTVGGYFGWYGDSEKYNGWKWSLNVFNIMAMANYYLAPKIDKMDLYAGIRLGYAGISSKYVYDSGRTAKYSWGSPFAYSFHVGANYWFNEKWAVNAELGYGIAWLSVGAAYKF